MAKKSEQPTGFEYEPTEPTPRFEYEQGEPEEKLAGQETITWRRPDGMYEVIPSSRVPEIRKRDPNAQFLSIGKALETGQRITAEKREAELEPVRQRLKGAGIQRAAEMGAEAGITFDLDDETAGLGAYLGAKAGGAKEDAARKAYVEARNQRRLEKEVMAEKHPIATIAGGLGGGLATGKLLGRLPALAQGPAQIGRLQSPGAAAGAIYGGVTGLGQAPDITDIPGTLGSVGKGVALGTAIGATTETAAEQAARLAKYLRGVEARKIFERFMGTPEAARRVETRTLKETGETAEEIGRKIKEAGGAPRPFESGKDVELRMRREAVPVQRYERSLEESQEALTLALGRQQKAQGRMDELVKERAKLEIELGKTKFKAGTEKRIDEIEDEMTSLRYELDDIGEDIAGDEAIIKSALEPLTEGQPGTVREGIEQIMANLERIGGYARSAGVPRPPELGKATGFGTTMRILRSVPRMAKSPEVARAGASLFEGLGAAAPPQMGVGETAALMEYLRQLDAERKKEGR